MNHEQTLLSTLRSLRQRLMAQLLLKTFSQATFIAGGGLVLLATLDRARPGSLWNMSLGLAWLLLVLVVAGGAAWHAHPSLPRTAAIFDRHAATRDRLATGLAFSRLQGRTEAQQLALQECATWVRGRGLAAALPWHWPRELRWLWVPAAAVALLRWQAHVATEAQATLAEAATRAVQPTVAQLQKLADTLGKQGSDARSEEMRRLAEQLQRSTERLRTEGAQGGDTAKATLRELSALEDLVRQMQAQRQAQLTPEELKATAQALSENKATADAAQKMAEGDLAGSAESLEKTAQELAAQGEERTAEEIQAALKAALEKLAQQKQLSEAARQMATSPPGAASAQMKRLAELLRKMPRQAGGPGGQPAEPMSPGALQRLLSALEDLKHGEGQGGHAGQQGQDASQMLLQALDRTPTSDLTGATTMTPTGKAGGELDKGTTDTPFGAQPNPSIPKGADLALQGQQGAGETASQLLPGATSDDSKARRKYRELYEAMAPAAEDAVQQENIPLGSRFFVMRYFEAIRPRE